MWSRFFKGKRGASQGGVNWAAGKFYGPECASHPFASDVIPRGLQSEILPKKKAGGGFEVQPKPKKKSEKI